MLDFFADAGASEDIKGEAYRALVLAARGADAVARLALTLIWLGLWPILDRLYLTQLRAGRPVDEAIGELTELLTREIERLPLDKGKRPVERPFGTITKNLRRDIIARLKELRAEARGLASLDEIYEATEPVDSRAESDFSRRVQALLRDPISAELVIRRVLFEERVEDIGAELGLKREAALKRYVRAMAALRPYFESRVHRQS
jgi:hypothetical protein